MKKICMMILFVLSAWSMLSASVDLEVGTDVLVETTSGVYVEIDGDLTETGTGYFKGIISSGSRTGMTTFAGLTLSSGMDGTIARTTGAAYAEGNGEGTNFKRYYELNNTGGSAVIADMQIVYVSSGINDERNGITDPYYVYSYKDDWIQYGGGSSVSPVSALDVDIPTGPSDWVISELDFINYITVISPNGGEDWQVGSSHDITWTSTGTSGSVKIEYSANNGSDWTDVIASTADDGIHPWIIPDTPSGDCLVRVSDTDGDPSDTSDVMFTISSIPCVSYIFTQQGWYMISLPVVPEDSSVSTLFPTALGSMAFGWDPVAGAYTVETEIKTRYGYWIAIPGATTDQVCGEPLESYTIHCGTQGWYMIGSVTGSTDFTNPDDDPDNQVLSPAFGWDTGTGSYYTTMTLEEKNGYWAAVFGECDLTVGGGGGGLPKPLTETNWNTFAELHSKTPPAPPELEKTTDDIVQIPTTYELFQNYPNPFNPETTFRYQLPEMSDVFIEIYSVLGQKVKTWQYLNKPPGYYTVNWNGNDDLDRRVSSGIYLIQMKAGSYQEIRKMTITH